MTFSCSLMFNSTFFTLRRIIRKICLKENLKLSFSSQKRNKSEVSTIKVSVPWHGIKKKKKKKKKKCCNINFSPRKSKKQKGFVGAIEVALERVNYCT